MDKKDGLRFACAALLVRFALQREARARKAAKPGRLHGRPPCGVSMQSRRLAGTVIFRWEGGRTHQPVEIRPRLSKLIAASGWYRRMRTEINCHVALNCDGVQASIEADVLTGLDGMIGSDGAIVVVMMGCPLPMEQRMLRFRGNPRGSGEVEDGGEVAECEREQHYDDEDSSSR
ncbi:hypothetical protein [Variovorax sp. dw_308]|uniref:hypothetical protein n=1 Tax=Variovorax sp. dw_308 TaxID=2721546 RepID=UPI001C47E4DF|nr:hypothetical protein [Variovorax sp. dw_308]